MIPLPPRSTPTDTRFPYTTLVRSLGQIGAAALVGARRADRLFQFIDGHHAQRGMADPRAGEDRDGEEGGAEALLHDGAAHRMAGVGAVDFGAEQSEGLIIHLHPPLPIGIASWRERRGQ